MQLSSIAKHCLFLNLAILTASLFSCSYLTDVASTAGNVVGADAVHRVGGRVLGGLDEEGRVADDRVALVVLQAEASASVRGGGGIQLLDDLIRVLLLVRIVDRLRLLNLETNFFLNYQLIFCSNDHLPLRRQSGASPCEAATPRR